MNAELEEKLTELRSLYFPKARNFLRAHITLFHALPDGGEWLADLEALEQEKFNFRVGPPYSIGRGVAVRIESAKLSALREKFARRWYEFLTPQDRQGYRPHCTLQNKVEPAKVALREIQASALPTEGEALGLTLSLYSGGPWTFVRDFAFAAGDPES